MKASVVGLIKEYVATVVGARADVNRIGWSRTDERKRVVDGSCRE